MRHVSIQNGVRSYHIKAVDRALDVLDALRQSESDLSLTQIADMTEQCKSTVYRMLVTLVSRGIVVKDESTGRYRLGCHMVGFAECAKSMEGVIVRTRPFMRILRDKLGHSVFLSLREGLNRVDVEQMEGIQKERKVIALGKAHALSFGSPGHVLAVGLLKNELASVLSAIQSGPTEKECFLQSIAAIRSNGFGWNKDHDGGLVVSAPIFGNGKVVAALSASLPAKFISNRNAMIQGITQSAASVSI